MVVVAPKAQAGGLGPSSRSGDDAAADEWLIAQVAMGDREAFRELYRRHGGSLFALVTRILDDHQMAEEVVQDTFLAVWNGARFDGRARVRTWLVAIAIRQAGSRRRRRRHSYVHQFGDPTSTDPTPEEVAIARDEVDHVIRDIADLSQLQREVVLLAFAEQLTHAEIADVLGIRLGTVKSRLHGARAALARKWEHGDRS